MHAAQAGVPDVPVVGLLVARATTSPSTSRSRRASSSAASARLAWWLWLQWQDQVWLQQMPDKGVWPGCGPCLCSTAEDAIRGHAGRRACGRAELQPRMKHVLTHLDWYLHPRRLQLDSAKETQALVRALTGSDASGRWVAVAELNNWGLPAPLRRLLQG
ncbi:MAG: NUDIX domain-containing protein [Aquabacterium sp.]